MRSVSLSLSLCLSLVAFAQVFPGFCATPCGDRSLGNDVKSVAWHPYKGLIATGDKNSIISLWDPRDGTRLRTIYEHKAEVSVCRWNKNGNWLLTGPLPLSGPSAAVSHLRSTLTHPRRLCNLPTCRLFWLGTITAARDLERGGTKEMMQPLSNRPTSHLFSAATHEQLRVDVRNQRDDATLSNSPT